MLENWIGWMSVCLFFPFKTLRLSSPVKRGNKTRTTANQPKNVTLVTKTSANVERAELQPGRYIDGDGNIYEYSIFIYVLQIGLHDTSLPLLKLLRLQFIH